MSHSAIVKTAHRLEVVVNGTVIFMVDLVIANESDVRCERLLTLLESYTRYLVKNQILRKETP